MGSPLSPANTSTIGLTSPLKSPQRAGIGELMRVPGEKPLPLKVNSCRENHKLPKDGEALHSQQKQDRNDIDLPEAEDIKKRWQEYTEELPTRTCPLPGAPH